MISRNLYFNIVFRVLIIVALALLLGYFVFITRSVRLSLMCSVALLILIINLVTYLNTTNRKVRFFFDSVRNDDSNLTFPADTKESGFRELYMSMNKVNKQIQQLKIENRHQEQYFQILLEHLATGIITYNSKGFILHANSFAKSLLSIDVLTHLQQIGRTDERLLHTINNIKPNERRLLAINTDHGEIQLSLKATSFKTKDDELVILSIQDIKNELDEKEVESWMKLIRVLMHEIMNSITPITSLSESLSSIYNAGGQQVQPDQLTQKAITTTLQGLNVIKEQGRGLMTFVESYRKLTRVPDPEKKLFKVAGLFERVRVLYNSHEMSNKISLSFSLKDPSLELYADQNLISQVLINLLKNAIEANENNPDGRIMIIAGIDRNKNREICVIDNGPGIAEDHLDKIFVPFFTTRKNGSGIGLSISRQIMRIHGGTLKVRSVPDKETIFCLSFPG
jgi:two-component system, NtrC family, nitrogen regulation sensor histidine kinase NtrY